MVQESIITLALLHKFVYEFRGNNTYIIHDRTALITISYISETATLDTLVAMNGKESFSSIITINIKML